MGEAWCPLVDDFCYDCCDYGSGYSVECLCCFDYYHHVLDKQVEEFQLQKKKISITNTLPKHDQVINVECYDSTVGSSKLVKLTQNIFSRLTGFCGSLFLQYLIVAE